MNLYVLDFLLPFFNVEVCFCNHIEKAVDELPKAL